MEKILMMVEVSRKQDYIFSSKKLRENAARSGEIAHVTGSSFFQRRPEKSIRSRKILSTPAAGTRCFNFPAGSRPSGLPKG